MSNESSKTAVMNLFRDLASVGQSVMDDIEAVRVNTLLGFEQFLSQANMLRTRVDRLCGNGMLGRFVVPDFNGVDIPHTSASLRSDAGAATLKERGTFVASPVKEVRFSADKGTYQSLNNTYKVMSTDGIPTGTFEVEYISPIMGNLVVFDLVTAAADVAVTVTGITPDLAELPAENVSRNGYRVSAWLSRQSIKALRISVTPTHADVAGGMGYTFGLTDLNSSSLTYHLAADLVFKPITVRPRTPKAIFRAPKDDGLSYFLSFDGVNYAEVLPNTEVALPGFGSFSGTGLGLNGGGTIQGVDLGLHPILRAVKVTDDQGNQLPVVCNLHAGDTPKSRCIIVSGSTLTLKPFNAGTDGSKTFNVSFNSGPNALQVWLKVKLSSDTNISTPVFTGASLEELV